MVARVNLIAQAALGALMGDLLLGRRLGRQAMAWGAGIAWLPETEGILALFMKTSHHLTFRHGPLHSFLLMTAMAFGLAVGLERLWKRHKITRAQAGLFVFAVLSGHTLLECLTADGAAVLWPFSGKRLALNLLSKIDLPFTAVLATAAVWLALLPIPRQLRKTRKKDGHPPVRRGRIRNIGLGAGFTLVLAGLGLKWNATKAFDQDLHHRGTSAHRRIVGPMPYNFLLWRAVIDRGDAFWVGYCSVFDARATPIRWTAYPRQAETLAAWEDDREIRAIEIATDGWWIARPHSKGAWIGDLRRPESRTWGEKPGMVDSRAARSWVFSAEGTDRLRQVDAEWHTSGSLGRMNARIFGDRGRWEANPRLAGVTGRFPEFLPVQE